MEHFNILGISMEWTDVCKGSAPSLKTPFDFSSGRTRLPGIHSLSHKLAKLLNWSAAPNVRHVTKSSLSEEQEFSSLYSSFSISVILATKSTRREKLIIFM